jgi:acid phosphatase
MNYVRPACPAVLAFVLLGCQTIPGTPPSASAYPPDDNLNALVWQQTSEDYRLIASETYRAAAQQLDRALNDPAWDALMLEDRNRPAAGLPPAVIVDVDETVLDNSAYQARLVRDRRAFDEFTWHNWAGEEAATAVPGAVAFTQAAAAKGIAVYYISNRAQDLEQVTINNLRKLGCPIVDPSQFLGLGTVLDGCEDNGSEKGCRRRLVGRSHRVLVQVGDQVVDMVTVLANTPEGRHQAVAPYLAWLGERWFVLPNATYGSWEPALFNNDWTQSAEDRRRQKMEALRY